jgi:serine/threonine-protein kinase HipA
MRADRPRSGSCSRRSEWSLAPAFDVTYSYNPTGSWTATHQMSMNGKRDGVALATVGAAWCDGSAACGSAAWLGSAT